MCCNGVNVTEKGVLMEHAKAELVPFLLFEVIDNIIHTDSKVCELMRSSSNAYLNAKIIEEGLTS